MSLYTEETKFKAIQMANLAFVQPSSFNFDKNLPTLAIPLNKPISRRKNFSPEEDKLLTDLVCKFGSKKWSTIAQYFKYRTARQCRERYNNYLAPSVFKGQWMKEEDDLLYEKYKEIGPKWSKMKVFFNNRSPNLLKNRWKYFVSKYYPPIQPKQEKDEQEENDNKNNDDSQSPKKENESDVAQLNKFQTISLTEKEKIQDDFKVLCDIRVNQPNLFMSLNDFEEIYTFPYLPQFPIQVNEPKTEEIGLYSIDYNLP